MSLHPFRAIDEAAGHRQPALGQGQIVRILLTFLACAIAFTLSARGGHADQPVAAPAAFVGSAI
jgi:hypothetical protein